MVQFIPCTVPVVAIIDGKRCPVIAWEIREEQSEETILTYPVGFVIEGDSYQLQPVDFWGENFTGYEYDV